MDNYSRFLLVGTFVAGCSRPAAPGVEPPPEPSAQPTEAVYEDGDGDGRGSASESSDWTEVVQAEGAALEDRFAGAQARIVVLDADSGQPITSYGAVDEPVSTGSTIKPLTVLAALRIGLDPDTQLDCSPVTLGEHRVADHHDYKTLSVAQVVARSSNVGIVQIARRVPWAQLYDQASALVPLPSVEEAQESTAIATLIGFSTRVTLGELAQGYVSMARDAEFGPQMMTMLERAVGPEGTGIAARVPDTFVAGKTGTAAHDGRHDALFVGFAGPKGARKVVAVSVAGLPDSEYGPTVAAPAFARIVGGALQSR